MTVRDSDRSFRQEAATPTEQPLSELGSLWDELFHACALEAYLTVAVETKCFPPDREKTRLIAYRLYEERLPYSKAER